MITRLSCCFLLPLFCLVSCITPDAPLGSVPRPIQPQPLLAQSEDEVVAYFRSLSSFHSRQSNGSRILTGVSHGITLRAIIKDEICQQLELTGRFETSALARPDQLAELRDQYSGYYDWQSVTQAGLPTPTPTQGTRIRKSKDGRLYAVSAWDRSLENDSGSFRLELRQLQPSSPDSGE